MVDVGTAALQIIPSFDGMQNKLEQGIGGPMGLAGTSGGRKYGDSAGRSMATAFASHAKKAALLAGVGLVAAGYAAFKIGKDSIAEAREAQKVGAVTEARIKSTGAAAKVTAKDVADLSTAISNKTGIDDEAIQSGANMLLTFTNLRNEAGKGNDIFTQATQTITDMSVAFKTDASSSAIQLGKALNDPIKGITALSRVGVAFTEQQKAQITTMVESGNTLGAQKVILAELKKEFGGTAAAASTNGEKVANAFHNMEEAAATGLLPIIDDIEHAFLKKGVPAIQDFIATFNKKGIPAIKNFADEAKPLVKKALPEIADALGTVKDVLADAAPYAVDLVEALNDMPSWAKKALVVGGLGAYAGSKLGLTGVIGKGAGGVVGAVTGGGVQKVFETNPAALGGGMGGVASKGGWFSKFIAGASTAGAAVAKAGIALPAAGALGNDTIDTHANPLSLTDADITRLEEAGYALEATGQMARDEMAKVAAAFQTLPPELQTHIAVVGGPESRKEAKELANQYDLTGAERKTLFSTFGIPMSKKEAKGLLDLFYDVGKPVNPKFSTPGLPGSKKQALDLLGIFYDVGKPVDPKVTLHGVPEAHTQAAGLIQHLQELQAAAGNALSGLFGGGGGGGGGGGNGHPRKVPPGRTGRVLPEKVILSVGGREFDAYVDERSAGTAQREIDDYRQHDAARAATVYTGAGSD